MHNHGGRLYIHTNTGDLDTSWTCVPLRETIVPECHHIVEACVAQFVFCLHLHSLERYIQPGIIVPASFIQWSNRVFLKLRKLGFLSSGSPGVTRLLEKQILHIR